MQTPLGTRIHIYGNSCSGKSTLAEKLAHAYGLRCVDLDRINWQPDWVALATTDPDLFITRINEETEGDEWIVAGSYTRFCRQTFWPRLQTIIWLDLPVPVLLWRVVKRSWRRWRTQELLWGTNRERFWPHLKVWNRDSLIWWIVSQSRNKRETLLRVMADPRYTHIRVIRIRSVRELEFFCAAIDGASDSF
ncbi:MAG: hypothetical protein EA383_02055 [Spirochaetaceae bacterium]|nr:MAG: hypothetical protein EA383_02055 [Spirochaetaceae bacterium]